MNRPLVSVLLILLLIGAAWGLYDYVQLRPARLEKKRNWTVVKATYPPDPDLGQDYPA